MEVVDGIGIWEAHPGADHHQAIFRIQQSITVSKAVGTRCACVHYADLLIRFPDGSQKRPDISIFCQEPVERRTAVTMIPEAVVKIISKGFEKKDTEVGAPFYLSQGVKDVILLNPITSDVTHHRRDGVDTHQSPKTLLLECGCVCTV